MRPLSEVHDHAFEHFPRRAARQAAKHFQCTIGVRSCNPTYVVAGTTLDHATPHLGEDGVFSLMNAPNGMNELGIFFQREHQRQCHLSVSKISERRLSRRVAGIVQSVVYELKGHPHELSERSEILLIRDASATETCAAQERLADLVKASS